MPVRTDEPVVAWLAGPSVAERMEVWKAVGMVMHCLGETQRESLALVRRYALQHHSTLDAVAGRLTALELMPADLVAAGFSVAASTVRAPLPGVEYPSRRCYLLAQLDSERL